MTSSHDDTLKQKSSDKKSENLLAKRFLGLEKNIWIEFSALAITHGAVNVGQGFIDYAPPHYFIDLY
ncbi:unnamed protein product, partial [Rotaria magnacalcarata]